MKTIKYFLPLLLLSLNFETVAQFNENSNIKSGRLLHSDDILIGEAHYILMCKEINEKDDLTFSFYLNRNNKTDTFSMVNINLLNKNAKILQNELISIIKKRDSLNFINDSTKIKQQLKQSSGDFLSKINFNLQSVSDSSMIIGYLYAKTNANIDTVVKPNFSLKSFIFSLNNRKINFTDSNRNKYKSKPFIIEKVELKFETEQIVGIKVIGKMSDNSDENLVFQNRVPISYSTKADISGNRGIKLYSKNNEYEIKLNDVFWNDYRFVNQTENYSPKDQVINLIPGENGKFIKKENELFFVNASIYSDLFGLNSTQPNGLIQTEISRRFYLYRKVIQITKSYSYIGFFNSIRPKITFSKIENDQKELEFNSKQLNYEENKLITNAIDIYKHVSWSSGGEVNLAYLGVPLFHSMFYLNIGGYIFNVPMKFPEIDKIESFKEIEHNENGMFNMNFVNFFPEVYWIISPHSMFRTGYSAKFLHIVNINKDFLDLNNSEKHSCIANILSLKFFASLKLRNNSNNEIFFRSNYNLNPKSPKQNFFQAQIGYSFNIFFDKNSQRPLLKQFEGI